MNYKVSVLVAAYNAEKYLRECLDSLIGQTLREIQIICVDDASTDNTLAILHEYEKKDERIVVLAQPENRGQAKARNRGLELATGEFVTMLDSDDWFAPDTLEKAYAVTREYPETDAVLLELRYFYQTTGEYALYGQIPEKEVYSGEEALFLSLDWQIHGVYLIRNTIHQAYPYDDYSRMYSDDNTTRIHYLHSREVRFSSGIYYYRQHNESNTNVHNIHRFDHMDAGLSLKRTLQKEGVSAYVIARLENLRWIIIVGLYIYYLQHKAHYSAEERTGILKRFRNHIQDLEPNLLPPATKYKFGYIPFRKCFLLFQAEVWLYYRIRKAFYKLTGKKLPSVGG